MKEMTATKFRRLPLIEWGRNGAVGVRSRGTVVGVWTPRDEWKHGLISARCHREALEDIAALDERSGDVDDLLKRAIEIASQALNAHQRAHNGQRVEEMRV